MKVGLETWYSLLMAETRKNKWKAPEWMVPGARVVVARSRTRPDLIGTRGTVKQVFSTGNGAKVTIVPDGIDSLGSSLNFIRMWINNVDPA